MPVMGLELTLVDVELFVDGRKALFDLLGAHDGGRERVAEGRDARAEKSHGCTASANAFIW